LRTSGATDSNHQILLNHHHHNSTQQVQQHWSFMSDENAFGPCVRALFEGTSSFVLDEPTFRWRIGRSNTPNTHVIYVFKTLDSMRQPVTTFLAFSWLGLTCFSVSEGDDIYFYWLLLISADFFWLLFLSDGRTTCLTAEPFGGAQAGTSSLFLTSSTAQKDRESLPAGWVGKVWEEKNKGQKVSH
jgi:hypothetical protein